MHNNNRRMDGGVMERNCIHCDYPLCVHHALTDQCPADDPYKQVFGDRKWAVTRYEYQTKEPAHDQS